MKLTLGLIKAIDALGQARAEESSEEYINAEEGN